MRSKQLSHSQYYKVCEWLKSNKDKILAQKPNIEELRKMASDELQVQISEPVIYKAKKDSGVYYISPGADKYSRLSVMQTKMIIVENQIAELTKQVKQLQDTLYANSIAVDNEAE